MTFSIECIESPRTVGLALIVSVWLQGKQEELEQLQQQFWDLEARLAKLTSHQSAQETCDKIQVCTWLLTWLI